MHDHSSLSNRLSFVFGKLKNKIAIKSSNKNYYYRDLFFLAVKISDKIKKKNQKNQIIVIVARKDFYTIASIFACIFLGHPYSVVDFSMPLERLKKILDKCNPKIIISSKKENFKFFNQEIINSKIKKFIDKKKIKVEDAIKKIPDIKTCYIMFTSGSTGFPKGAMINRGSLLKFSKLCKQNFQLKQNDNLTNLNPVYFDNSIFDIFASLLNGLTLSIFTEDDLKVPIKIFNKIRKFKPTVWFSTPSLLIYLINLKILSKKNIKFIKKIIFGGEAFPIDKLKQLYEIDTKKVLYNVYGPTETTCICSSYKIQKRDIYNLKSDYVSIGKIWKSFNYNLIKNNKLVKNSKEIGELYLFGHNVGMGYINDGEQSFKSFIINKKNKTRGYKTGDLFYESKKDKYLYFKGRKDNQVKVMGHRIELSEIEAAMNSIENVDEVAVFAKKIKETNKIIAVVCGKKITSNKYIYEKISVKLPKYMIPSNIFLIKKMLKNPNGKIDRAKIKKIYEAKTFI